MGDSEISSRDIAGQLVMVFGSSRAIAGVDEAGRGPLAGPVVAAAVILDEDRSIADLRDSKRLTAGQRDRLAREVRKGARAYAVALAAPSEIDALNILQASLLAMSRAVRKLGVTPTHVQVDGNQLPRFDDFPLSLEVEAVVRGDALVPAISAASILAKVSRDRLMRAWHQRYPDYGFDRHKGYPTPDHLAALATHGPCPIHRRSFGPVRALLQERRA